MLAAWDKAARRTLALPDWEARDLLEQVRDRTRRGELVCLGCEQPLWLRAGDIRIPHFGHRSLSNCPHGRVSDQILAARRQLYLFFSSRIAAGKLLAEVELEPRLPELDPESEIDVLLRRKAKPPVAVMIIERGLKPEARTNIRLALARSGWKFRPIFLHDRLKPVPNAPGEYLLETTQRDYLLASAYDLRPAKHAWPGTLHFIDATGQRWTTLRGLSLIHEPQVYQTDTVRTSPLDALLWSEAHSEWVHPGEAEALKALREAEAEQQRKQKEAELARERARKAREAEAQREREQEALEGVEEEEEDEHGPLIEWEPVRIGSRRHGPLEASPAAPPPPVNRLPGWITAGLLCIGCNQRTTDWQNAAPGKDLCVCRACFSKGVRLVNR